MTRPITQSTKTVRGVELRTPPLPEPVPRVSMGSYPPRLTVACVWWGTQYGVEYVKRLRNMVARNMPPEIPYDFVCITTHKVPEDVIRMKPPTMVEGWWQKVGLFSPDLFGPSQRVLYFDLDLVIVNSIGEITSVPEPFCMIENFGMNKGHAAHNSSCMLWTPTAETARIFTQFSPDVMKHLHGDQCWIWRVMQGQIFNWRRSQLVSYKYEKLSQYRHQQSDTSVIVFHGQPKPHQVKDPLIVENWK